MLAWMDLEMTGLDPYRNKIVEIATLITDDNLELVAEGPDLVIGVEPEDLEAMVPVVQEMHARSGLTEAIVASKISLAEAGEATMEFLRTHIDEPRSVPLCGSSIGTDRRFLAVHLPEVEEFLHYRSVDVSSIKELLRRWNPELAANTPPKAQGHRAMDDIRESLEELRYYRDHAFVLAQPPTES